jgi:hypothetical protein
LTNFAACPDFEKGGCRGLRSFDGHLGGIEIEVSDGAQANDLADFLRGLCFDVEIVGERTLEARFRDPIPPDQEAGQLEVDLYLRVWVAIHPEAWAVRVG